MPKQYRTSKNFERILAKLLNRDNKLYENILSKMNEILNSSDIEHYKNLRYNLKEYKRANVGSFVIVFKYDRQNNMVYFEDFDHHDNIYRR